MSDPYGNVRADAAFHRFIHRNRAFWHDFDGESPGSETPGSEAPVVLLDLMVEHPGYMLGNAYLAKLLQRHYGARLHAVMPAPGHQVMEDLAHSFGVEKIWYETELPEDVDLGGFLTQAIQGLSGLPPRDFRRRLQNLKLNGFRLGDLIYDSMLREDLSATLEGPSDSLFIHLGLSLKYHGFYQNIFTQEKVVAAVVGHVTYIRFGLLTRMALKHGAEVFGKRHMNPLQVRRYAGPDVEICAMEAIRADVFDPIFESQGEAFAAKGRAFLEQRFSGGKAITAGEEKIGAYGRDKRHYGREALFEGLGLDPQKPLITVMAHAMADNPHLNTWGIYADSHEWLTETLALAQQIDTVNWLFKPHPSADFYEGMEVAEALIQPVAEAVAHVALAPKDLHTAALFDMTSAMVTIYGKAAMEFAAQGIPVIIAGDAPYAGLGFTIEPESEADYAAVLAGVPDLPPLGAEAVQRAQAFTYLFFEHLRTPCHFLPKMVGGHWDEYDLEKIWTEAAEALDNTIEDDPFAQAVHTMLETDAVNSMGG